MAGGPDAERVHAPDDLVRELDLLRARAARGTGKARVSLADLAGRVGLPRSTVHSYVSGASLPPAEVLDALVIALGATAAEQASWAEAWYRVQSERQTGRRPEREAPPHDGPHQLPRDVMAFTGRAGQLRALDDRLAALDEAVVVVAISGTAGAGKTALAVHWAHSVADRFPDGQLFVNLRGYDPDAPVDTADALAVLLRALGVPGPQILPTTPERAAQYRTALAGRRVLVVLDNAGSVAQVRDLLPGTPGCLALITSRDALTGLVVRDGAHRLDLDLLTEPEAVELLTRLVGDTGEGQVRALARACARLPLALRIAAELVRSGVEDLATDLADEDRRLDLLDAGGDPHTAMRAVLSWSVRGLSPAATRMLALLGVHPGRRVDRYSAAALAGIDPAEARRLLDELARAHLVHRLPDGRVEQHDLLRADAVERAADLPGAGAALMRLHDYYRATASHLMGLLHPSDTSRPVVPEATTAVPDFADASAAIAWVAAELDNLVALTANAAQHGFAEHAHHLTTTLWKQLDVAAYRDEAMTMFTNSLVAARTAAYPAGEASALRNLATVLGAVGRYEQALEHLRQALAICRDLGDDTTAAAALTSIGVLLGEIGRFAESIEAQEESLAIRLRTGDRLGAGASLLNLGVIYQETGDLEGSLRNFEQAMSIFQEIGDRLGQAHALTNLGNVERLLGAPESGLDHLLAAKALYTEFASPLGVTYALAGQAMCEVALHRTGAALTHHRAALAMAGELGVTALEAEILNDLGATLAVTGDTAAAEDAHRCALDIAERHQDAYEHARALHLLGRLRADADQLRRAAAMFDGLNADAAGEVRADLAELTALTRDEPGP